jgi:branched-subunit amino acid aminotransferase/4-amino-4-deoxychorismate lyase
VTGGRVERLERHAGRLLRDAARLGLPLPTRVDIEHIFLTTAAETFGSGDGIVRVEWSRLPKGEPELIAATRPLGDVPARWRVSTSSVVHPGLAFRANTKYVDVEAYDLGRAEVREADVDEVLLFDADGFLVEGAHSNILVVQADGRLVTPAPSLGGVEGLGLAIVRENRPEVGNAHLRREDLSAAVEVMSCNAVRGVVPIIEIDGEPIPADRPGSWAQRLRGLFFRDR